MSEEKKPVLLSKIVSALDVMYGFDVAYYNPENGEIMTETSPDDMLLDFEESEKAEERLWELIDRGCIFLPKECDLDDTPIVISFAEKAGEPELLEVFHGRGKFRAFKDAARRLGLIEDYYAYRLGQLAVTAREWCQKNDVPYIDDVADKAGEEEDTVDDALIDAAGKYAESLFAGRFDGHAFDHTERVYRNAMMIAEKEKCDRTVVALAALLHDADDPKLFDTKDKANARQFLRSQEVDAETEERVIAAVNSVSFRKNRGKKPSTIEAMIVQDADRLDAIGAIGIARTFSYGGANGRSLYESVRHFHEKLLLLRDMMNTRTAKRIAERRHEFMLEFLRELERETGEGK